MVLPANSLRAAINDKCKCCVESYDYDKGVWQEQVHMCPRIRCPLYKVRPRLPVNKHARHIIWLMEEPGHPFWTTREGWLLSSRLEKDSSKSS